jgi:hypothetical protein
MKPTSTRGTKPRGLCRQTSRLFVVAALLLTTVPSAPAQTDYGSVEIIVVEAAAPPAPAPRLTGVRVTLSGGQGLERTCSTDAGRCFFGAVAPGAYLVSARRESTPPESAETLRLRVYSGRGVTRTIVLAAPPSDAEDEQALPLAVQERVPEEGWLAERTTPARLGLSGTSETIARLPNRGTEISTLFETTPGTLFTDTGGVSFNGQPGSQNVTHLEGFDTTPHVLAPSSFQDTNAFVIFDPGKRQSFKALDAFSLDTNNTPAALGTGTGGKLLTSIKQGQKLVINQAAGEFKNYSGEAYWFTANDAFSARNFFDPAEKPSLDFHLFGAKLGGPLHAFGPGETPEWFYFINYEGIRANSGTTLLEAVPTEAARALSAPAVAPLFDGFRAGSASLVTGASADPSFDILRLDADNAAARNAVTLRLDYNRKPVTNSKKEVIRAHSFAFLYTRAHAREETPEGVTGRRQVSRNVEQNAVFRYTRLSNKSRDTFKNEFLIGLNQTPSRLGARSPFAARLGLAESAVGVAGRIPRTDGERPVAVATVGGLLRDNSRFKGRGLLTNPTRLSIIDQLVWVKPSGHTFTFGGEFRLLRTGINQLFGTTYNFSNLASLLANTPTTVQFVGDLGSFSAAEGAGATGEREAAQEYYIGFAQHEWKSRPNLRLAYGLRYEFYSPLREKQDRAVVFDVREGRILPPATPFHQASKYDFLPRASVSWAPRFTQTNRDDFNLNPTIISASFGMHTGPGVFSDLIKPIESDRIQVTRDGGRFPLAPADSVAAFAGDPDDRRFQPLTLARDYLTPARVYKYDVSVKRDLVARASGHELFVVATYAGNLSRNLLLRNFTNSIVSVETNPDPTRTAIVTREFDFVRDGRVFHPFGEIEYRTSGGRLRYDSLQLVLKGRWDRLRLTLFDAQYTLARNRGNTNGAEKTSPAGNTFDYDYDEGFHIDDVRHNLSVTTVFDLPCEAFAFCKGQPHFLVRHLLRNWSLGTIFNRQSGRPIDLRITRPDVVYLDAENRVFNTPGVGRRAVINVPGGGGSLNARRPDLVPGMSPYLDAGRRFLNPAAFATPAPGTFGNLPRGAIRAPALTFFDFSARKEFKHGENGQRVFAFRVDITNVLNMANFDRPAAVLPDALGADAATQLQPGRPFTDAAAGSEFGILNRTFKREQDLGASRQIQFGFSFKF